MICYLLLTKQYYGIILLVINMKEIEIEYKILLTKEQHDKILDKVDFKYYVEQVNYYFETEDNALKESKMTLRVRNIDQKYYLMLKEFNGVVSDETIQEISLEQFKFITQEHKLFDSEIRTIIESKVDLPILSNQASLKTKRYYTPYMDCVLFLDESYYYGKVDYELELEAPSIEIGRNVFDKLLVYYNLEETEVVGKRKRAFNQKNLK